MEPWRDAVQTDVLHDEASTFFRGEWASRASRVVCGCGQVEFARTVPGSVEVGGRRLFLDHDLGG